MILLPLAGMENPTEMSEYQISHFQQKCQEAYIVYLVSMDFFVLKWKKNENCTYWPIVNKYPWDQEYRRQVFHTGQQKQ